MKPIRTNILLLSLLAPLLVAAQSPVDKAWATLTLAVGDKSPEKRARAIQSLGLIHGDSKATGMAENALSDADEEVRAAAATALGQMGAGGSAPKLRQAVKDPAAGVVFAATNALFVLGDPSAFEVYYAVLAGEKKSGETLLESQSKMIQDPKALARVGFEAGIGFVPFGGVSYKAFKMMTKDDVSPIRSAAASKLARDPDPKTLKLLETAVSDKKWLVRAAAIDALAKRGDPASMAAIAPALDDENEVVRFTACAAVLRLTAANAR
jgi:HEAT repeat protein